MISRRCPKCGSSNTHCNVERWGSFPGADVIDWMICNNCGEVTSSCSNDLIDEQAVTEFMDYVDMIRKFTKKS
jgi:uncharacterized Fe-S center protein